MNLLTDTPPEHITVGDKDYAVHSGFRTWIQIDLALFEQPLSEQERVLQALRLCYIDLPPDLGGALRGILDFYACGRAGLGKRTAGTGDSKRVYSFAVDDKYIYAAFLSQYGIDLTRAQLHWWEFCSLFEGLDEENKICKIMGWRAMDLSKIKDKQQKAFYRRMKALYKLPDCRTEAQKEADMLCALDKMI